MVASAAAASSARPPTTAGDDAAAPTTRTLAGAVFVTGNVPLTPGLRYLLAMTDGRFEVRGPVDTDPTVVAFSRPAASLDAVSLNGRLILNAADPGTDATSMVFINLRGTDADGVVETFGRLRTSPAPPS